MISRETAFDPAEVRNLISQPQKEINTATVMAMSGLGPQALFTAMVEEVTVEYPDAIDDVLAGLTGTSATPPGAAIPSAPIGVYLGPLEGPADEGLAGRLSTEAQAGKKRKPIVSNSATALQSSNCTGTGPLTRLLKGTSDIHVAFETIDTANMTLEDIECLMPMHDTEHNSTMYMTLEVSCRADLSGHGTDLQNAHGSMNKNVQQAHVTDGAVTHRCSTPMWSRTSAFNPMFATNPSFAKLFAPQPAKAKQPSAQGPTGEDEEEAKKSTEGNLVMAEAAAQPSSATNQPTAPT